MPQYFRTYEKQAIFVELKNITVIFEKKSLYLLSDACHDK
jgi:hypothetical protein